MNDDKPEIELPEIVVTRRLYRDGKSEYEVNRQAAKHGDIVLLLAQAGIGQRTYSVIGRGMVDAVLVASPAERKEFLTRPPASVLSSKRHQATNRLETAKQNLSQAERCSAKSIPAFPLWNGRLSAPGTVSLETGTKRT